jgi:hypothetical protein
MRVTSSHLAAALLLAGAAVACGKDDTGGGSGDYCRDDDQCRSGFLCVTRRCVAEPRTTRDAGPPDVVDAGMPDTGDAMDAGMPDTGPVDTGVDAPPDPGDAGTGDDGGTADDATASDDGAAASDGS